MGMVVVRHLLEVFDQQADAARVALEVGGGNVFGPGGFARRIEARQLAFEAALEQLEFGVDGVGEALQDGAALGDGLERFQVRRGSGLRAVDSGRNGIGRTGVL